MNRLVSSAIVSFLLVAEASAMTLGKMLVRQQDPWDERVRIEYRLDGEADETATVDCFVRRLDGAPVCDTLTSLGGSWAGERFRLKPGFHVLWWTPAKGCVAADVEELSFALAIEASNEKYMIVDISNPEAYEVSYTNDIPASALTEEMSPGMDSNVYRETKIVLRHIRPGTFMMGSPVTETGRATTYAHGDFLEDLHQVTLTNEFWIGVFPISRGQWMRICPAQTHVSPNHWRTQDGQGFAYNVSRLDIVGENSITNWPNSTDVDELEDVCLLGRLRNRSRGQLPAGFVFAMPTEAQWEYACRAGTTTAFNDGSDLVFEEDGVTSLALDRLGRYKEDANGLFWIRIASFQPNAWGLYDMHGGVAEIVWDMCPLDLSQLGTEPVVEPRGKNYVGFDWGRQQTVRGGYAYCGSAAYCRSAARRQSTDAMTGQDYNVWGYCGFRLAVTRAVKNGVNQ